MWAIAEGKHNKLPLTIRFRNELQTRPDIVNHPHLIQITWAYDGLESGLPGNLINEQMSIFEDRLTSAVEHDASAVLVAVITNDGEREWSFYSSDVQEFANRLSNMPQAEEKYPIDMTTRNDPEWEFLYMGILAGMSGNES